MLHRHRLFVTVVAAFSCSIRAVVINVPGDQPTIQAGINAANSGGCGVPGTGDCLLPNGTPFCDDTCGAPAKPCVSCCYIVCALDPFCCDVEWDVLCVDEAQELCVCAAVDVPPNNDCINAIEVFVGPAFPVSNQCGSPDGPAHNTCNDGFTGMGVDVWFFYNATFDGALTITPTPLDPLLWQTQLAVYEGTNCGALSDPPYVCAGIDSSAVVPVTTGASYLIRLGGTFVGPVGPGTLQLAAVPGSCPWDCDSAESTDGTVGIVDFLALLAQWGGPGSCDFDGGGVGIVDFLDLLAHWGPCP